MDRSVPYFLYSQKMLSFGGLWHTQTHRERLLRYHVVGFMSLYVVLGESCQLLASNFDLRTAVRLLQVLIPTICGASVYFNAVLHFKRIQKISSFILRDSQLLKDDTELKIMQKYAYYSNRFTFASSVMLYTYGVITLMSSLLRIILSTNDIRSDLDLYPIISCFDYFSSRGKYYYPIIMYQTITVFGLMTVSLACYSKIFTFFIHVCACLSIIKYKICSPFIYNNHDNDILITPIDLSPWVIDIVQYLAKTKELMTLVNATFEKSNLFQISLSFFLIILDFLCIPVSLEHKAPMKDVLTLGIYISGTLFTIYLNCYIGQTLIDYSLDIYREVSLVPFYKMSLNTQKLLLTTLTMCAQPYEASIGKVYVASNEFFSNLLRTSLSFAMVVHSLQAI